MLLLCDATPTAAAAAADTEDDGDGTEEEEKSLDAGIGTSQLPCLWGWN